MTKLSTKDLYVGTKAQLDVVAAGCLNGASAFCSDGRNPGEGVGAGTGVPVWYHRTSGEWRDYATNAEVTV